MSAHPLTPIDPSAIRIEGARPIARTLHRDPRGFLVEMLRSDDRSVDGDRFAMAYTSVTVAGGFRDRDRWHVHAQQTDRFVVPAGEMILALYDGRAASPSHGLLDVIRMKGAPFDDPGQASPGSLTTHLVPIPPGVLHCIGNLSERPFVLVNFPTQLYDAADEGRVPFPDRPVAALGGPFRWEDVPRRGGAR
jgi:dTDP-4-dehydrorhamnose 3,5-epimerase